MRSVEKLFSEYQAFHKDPRNKVCHYFGITMIVLAVVALVARYELVEVGGFAIDLGLVGAVATVAFYLVLDVPLGVGAAALLGGLWLAGRQIPWQASVGLFVLGWILQFVGHAFEGKRPAFFRNGVHLLVGPLWILSHLYEKLGLRARAAGAQA